MNLGELQEGASFFPPASHPAALFLAPRRAWRAADLRATLLVGLDRCDRPPPPTTSVQSFQLGHKLELLWPPRSDADVESDECGARPSGGRGIVGGAWLVHADGRRTGHSQLGPGPA